MIKKPRTIEAIVQDSIIGVHTFPNNAPRFAGSIIGVHTLWSRKQGSVSSSSSLVFVVSRLPPKACSAQEMAVKPKTMRIV
jgi:hypothetical protein